MCLVLVRRSRGGRDSGRPRSRSPKRRSGDGGGEKEKEKGRWVGLLWCCVGGVFAACACVRACVHVVHACLGELGEGFVE